MKDILERIEESSPNESSHELICRLHDCADEISKLRSSSDAAQAPVAWKHRDNHTVMSDKQKRDVAEHNGSPGKRIADDFCIPLYAATVAPQAAGDAAQSPAAWQYRPIVNGKPYPWIECTKEAAERLRAADYRETHEVRDLYAAPVAPAAVAPSAEIAGLESAIGHLSALVETQRRLLADVNEICGVDGHGGTLEDGESEIIDRVRAHLAILSDDHSGEATEMVAQPDERAAFEKNLSVEDSFRKANGEYLNPRVRAAWEAIQTKSSTAGMTLGERIAHVGGRENADGYIEFGSVMAVDALIRRALRDAARATAPQATVKGDERAAIDACIAENGIEATQKAAQMILAQRRADRAAVPQAGATLTDEQREAAKAFAARADDMGEDELAELLRSILAAHPTEQAGADAMSNATREEQPSLTNPLTHYGMLVRALRIVAGTTLYEMGKHLQCSPAFLSAVEFGRKPVTDAMVADAAAYFSSLGIADTLHALDAARTGGKA